MDEIERLIVEYGNACLAAGQANSGMCIDIVGPLRMEGARELKDELIEAIHALMTGVANDNH